MKEFLTDEEVESEIKALSDDEDVRLARAEQRLKYKRRQTLYGLRFLKKRGKEIRSNPDYAWLVEMYQEEEE